MSTHPILTLAAALLATMVGMAGAQSPRRPSPPQPQQRHDIAYFIGSWSFTWDGRESANSRGPRSGTVTFTRLGDTDFLEMKLTDAGPFVRLGSAKFIKADTRPEL